MIDGDRLEQMQAHLDEEGVVDTGIVQELLTEVVRLHTVLEILAKLGNEPVYGNSDGNCIAQQALKVGKYAETDSI